MGFKIVEDRPTPKEVYNWRMYLFAATAAMGAMAFGYDGAFFGTTYARSSFQSHFGITTMSDQAKKDTSANLTSSYLAAGFFGAIAAWPVMEVWGRRWGLRISTLIFLAGGIAMTVTDHSLPVMCESRLAEIGRA
jgi:hypothetical protein